MNWVYILRCGDGSLYTGWTNDLEERVRAHAAGTGAKYTRSHLPVKLAYCEQFETVHEAMSREWHIKRMSAESRSWSLFTARMRRPARKRILTRMNRRYELDLCRICACVMVLVIHACSGVYHDCPLDSAAFVPFNFISTAVRGSVPLFFMLSGTLMLDRERLELRPFLRGHVLRLLGLFCFWSLLYAAGGRVASGSFGSLYDLACSVVAGHYHMWFLSAMIMCYLFMPVLHSALHGVKLDARWLTGVLLFTVLLMANFNLTPDPAPLLNRITLNFSFDYLAYLLYIILGWRLGQMSFGRRTLYTAPAVFLMCAALASACNRWYSNYRGYADGWLFSYFSLPNFIMAGALFCFFSAMRGHKFRREKLIRELSDCTLGVYLMHPLVINILERFGIGINAARPILSSLGFTALLALCCFALTYIARWLPLVRRLL